MKLNKVFLFLVFILGLFSLSYGATVYTQSTDYVTKVTNNEGLFGSWTNGFTTINATGFYRTWTSNTQDTAAYITFTNDVKTSRTTPINVSFNYVYSGTKTDLFTVITFITNSTLGNNDGLGHILYAALNPEEIRGVRYTNAAFTLPVPYYSTGSNTYFQTNRLINILFNSSSLKIYVDGTLRTENRSFAGTYTSFKYLRITTRNAAASTTKILNMKITTYQLAPPSAIFTSFKTQKGALTNNSYFNTTTLNFNVTTNQPTNKKYTLSYFSNGTFISSGLMTGSSLSSYQNLTIFPNKFKIYFNATNVNGTVISSNYTFTIDTTKPFIDFSKISATYNTPSPPRLNISIIEQYPNTCKYKLDSAAYASCTNSTFNTFVPASLTVGLHTLYVNATDLAGNFNISSTTFDYNPRRIVITFLNVLNNNTVSGIAFRDRNFSTNYNTGMWSNLTLYHNAGTYNYNLTKAGYQRITSTYTISAVDVISYKTILLSPIYNISLVDEVSLKPFNLTGTSSVYLRITCANESVQQYLITTNNFGINVSCFYTEFKFVVNYPSTSYFRSILLDVQQTKFNVYLMNLITTQSVLTSYRAFDLIGEYINPKLVFYKSISGTISQITGDFVDASGNVPAYLVLGDKYQLKLFSDNQPTKDLGFISAVTGGSVSLVLFQVAFKPNYFNKDYNFLHQEYLTSVGVHPILIAQYNDTGSNTNSVTLEVRRSNEYGPILYTSSSNAQKYMFIVNLTPYNITGDVYVKMTANTGYQTTPLYYVKQLRVQGGTVDLGITFTNVNLDWVITIVLSFLALIFTVRTASMGGLVLVGVAALCIVFGWFTLSWAFYTLALVMVIVSLWFGVKEGS